LKVLLIATNMESRMNNRMNAQPLPIGLAYIAGFIDGTRHSVKLLDLMFSTDYEADIRSAVTQYSPDAVGISLRNLSNHSFIDTRWALPITKNVIEIIKNDRNIPVIIGGPGFSTMPVLCFNFVGADYGLVGDSGEAFNNLITDLQNKTFEGAAYSGIVYRDHGEVMYDGRSCTSSFSPRPYYEGLDLDAYNAAGFGIGVVTKLTSWQYSEGDLRVFKSPSDILSELRDLSKLNNFKKVFFIDNAFNVPGEPAKNLCEELIRENLGIHWSTVLSPGNPDSELIALMKRAGCVFTLITATDYRDVGPGSIYDICRNNAVGFGVNVGFGGRGETQETVNEKITFLNKADATISYLRYGVSVMPGSPEARAMIENRSISSEDELVKPHFYVDPQVDGWLLPTLERACSTNPKWNLT